MKNIYRASDIDGRWFRFVGQEKGMSCVVASVKIAKECFHDRIIEEGEEVFRGVATLVEQEAGKKKILPNSGTSSLDPKVQKLHNWNNVGMNAGTRWLPVPKVDESTGAVLPHGGGWSPVAAGVLHGLLRSWPLPIPSPRPALGSIELLRAATRRRPVLIGWYFPRRHGYHMTVCIGPTPSQRAPDQVVILDPADGLRYVDLTDLYENRSLMYRPSDPRAKDPFCPKGHHRSKDVGYHRHILTPSEKLPVKFIPDSFWLMG